ncbi:MAG: hypothetical protein JSV52_13175, partial [Candidatus Zixiibacteriota bacterium]
MKQNLTVEVITGEAYETAAALVEKLLNELGEEGDDTGKLNAARIKKAWKKSKNTATFIARNE